MTKARRFMTAGAVCVSVLLTAGCSRSPSQSASYIDGFNYGVSNRTGAALPKGVALSTCAGYLASATAVPSSDSSAEWLNGCVAAATSGATKVLAGGSPTANSIRNVPH